MEKILVATDLSANSASAIRFARMLAQSRNSKLIVAYVYYVRKPSSWRTHRFETYLKFREQYLSEKLNKLLKKIFGEGDEIPIHFQTKLIMGINPVTALLKAANGLKSVYICISTKGGGNSENNIGHITGKLILKSPLPVISVPSNWKTKPLDEICYLTNMSNYRKEVKKVADFAKPLKSSIKLLHIFTQKEKLPRVNALETKLAKRSGMEIKVRFISHNPLNCICEDIDKAVKRMKSKMVILFIKRARPYGRSMFNPTNTKPLSLYLKIPILSLKK